MVTGASSGIGIPTSELLARAGHRVVLAARRTQVCEEVAAKLRAEGADAQAVPLDLGDEASIDSFVAQATEAVGAIDTVVHNAGVSRVWKSTDSDSSALRDLFAVNVIGTQHLTSALLPSMIESGRGDFVFVSSEVVGLIPPRPRMAAYSASKHALEAWIRVLALELEGTGVRTTTIRPGATYTGQADAWGDTDMAELVSEWDRTRAISHWAPLQPADVAATIAHMIAAPPHVSLRLVEIAPTHPRATS